MRTQGWVVGSGEDLLPILQIQSGCSHQWGLRIPGIHSHAST